MISTTLMFGGIFTYFWLRLHCIVGYANITGGWYTCDVISNNSYFYSHANSNHSVTCRSAIIFNGFVIIHLFIIKINKCGEHQLSNWIIIWKNYSTSGASGGCAYWKVEAAVSQVDICHFYKITFIII